MPQAEPYREGSTRLPPRALSVKDDETRFLAGGQVPLARTMASEASDNTGYRQLLLTDLLAARSRAENGSVVAYSNPCVSVDKRDPVEGRVRSARLEGPGGAAVVGTENRSELAYRCRR